MKKITYLFLPLILMLIINNCTGYKPIFGQSDLNFEILRTDSTGMVMGGTSGIEIPYYPVQLWVDEKMACIYVY